MKIQSTKIKITASEIGQYIFCPMSWYLQQKGYQPESTALQRGQASHTKLGHIIEQLPAEHHQSKLYAIIGFILFFLAVGIILFEVFI